MNTPTWTAEDLARATLNPQPAPQPTPEPSPRAKLLAEQITREVHGLIVYPWTFRPGEFQTHLEQLLGEALAGE